MSSIERSDIRTTIVNKHTASLSFVFTACIKHVNPDTFRSTNGDFYVALGSSMGLALLVWVGGGLLKRILYFFGNKPSLGQKSPILHLPLPIAV